MCEEHAVAQLVETICYKPEGRGFDSLEGHLIFNLPNFSSRAMPLESTHPLTEMVPESSWGKRTAGEYG
jgi:hypothetical protein